MSQHNLPSQWEQYRAAFEADAGPLGFDLTRRESITGEPWTEYAEEVTGQRFGGFIAAAALSEQGAGEAVAGKWDGAEEWMPLAWELCADECGEESCTELVWEGGPIPEPWGDRWLKYEDEAKRLIALVRKHTRPQAAQPARVVDLLDWAVSRWNDEVKHRPLVNKNRRTLDDTWRQVIRFAGGNPDDLVGPSHDALLSTPPAAPAPSQQADHSPDGGNMVEQQAGEVTELRAALWHIKNTAISLSDAQVIALEALAAYEAKKAGE